MKPSDGKIVGALALEKRRGGDKVRAGELRERCKISAPAFAAARKRLEDENLIQVEDGEDDSRKKYYSLTDFGERFTGPAFILSASDELILKTQRYLEGIEEIEEFITKAPKHPSGEDLVEVYGRFLTLIVRSVDFKRSGLGEREEENAQ